MRLAAWCRDPSGKPEVAVIVRGVLTGMLEYASYLSSDRSLFDTLNDDAKAGVLEGLAELNRGEGIPIERHDMMRRKRLSAAVS